jgi:hypothetical protein
MHITNWLKNKLLLKQFCILCRVLYVGKIASLHKTYHEKMVDVLVREIQAWVLVLPHWFCADNVDIYL